MNANPTPSVWPQSAQLAAAFLLGIAVTLLGVRVSQSHSWGARPLDLERPLRPLDLNVADVAELQQLPGVGPMLADRIVEHRRASGRFHAVEELSQVPGVGPSTLAQVRPWLGVAPPLPTPKDAEPLRLSRKPTDAPPPATPTVWKAKELPTTALDPNRATLQELQQLPGVGPVLAGRIVAARDEKPFVSLDDLRRVKGIGVKTLAKMRPYLRLGASE